MLRHVIIQLVCGCQKRMFVLSGAYIYYYVTNLDREPRGALCIEGAIAKEEPEVAKVSQHTAAMVHAGNEQ